MTFKICQQYIGVNGILQELVNIDLELEKKKRELFGDTSVSDVSLENNENYIWKWWKFDRTPENLTLLKSYDPNTTTIYQFTKGYLTIKGWSECEFTIDGQTYLLHKF